MFAEVRRTCSSEITGPRAHLFGGVKHKNQNQAHGSEPQLWTQIAQHTGKTRLELCSALLRQTSACPRTQMQAAHSSHDSGRGQWDVSQGQSVTSPVSIPVTKPPALSTYSFCWLDTSILGKSKVNPHMHCNSQAFPPSSQTCSGTAA